MDRPAYRRPDKVLVYLYRRSSGRPSEGAQKALEYLLRREAHLFLLFGSVLRLRVEFL